MACSTCDGYEFVLGDDGMLEDCPDCRAIDPRPLVWCPTHSTRVEIDGRCRKCCVEAGNGEAFLARARATTAALTAKTARERQSARDLVARARLLVEEGAAA